MKSRLRMKPTQTYWSKLKLHVALVMCATTTNLTGIYFLFFYFLYTMNVDLLRIHKGNNLTKHNHMTITA